MKRKNLFLLVLGLLVLVLSGCALGNDSQESNTEETSTTEEATETNVETTEIVVGSGGRPMPYVTVDADGQPAGYDIEVVQEIFNRIPEYELRLELTDIPAILTGVSTGTYDIAANNFSYNEARAENYYYSFPYNNTRYVFIYNENNPVTSLDEAAENGMIYTGLAGTAATTAVENYNEANPDAPIEIEYSEADTPVLFQQLQDSEDTFKIDDYPVYYVADQEFDYQDLETTEVGEADADYINTVTQAHLLFAKTDEGLELRNRINEVIKEMAEDGTLKELTEAHFGTDQTPPAAVYEEPVN